MMAKLTKKQIAFLAKHLIPVSSMFDASHTQGNKDRVQQMEDQEKIFSFGGTQCKFGHGLRSKSNHCIECHTKAIAFTKRSGSSGHVYLAYSTRRKLAKIGFTKLEVTARLHELNRKGYGNTRDWQLIEFIHVEQNAGRCEFEIHKALEQFRADEVYEKTPGQLVQCYELFECTKRIAHKALGLISADYVVIA
jgi:T5orf172 domain